MSSLPASTSRSAACSSRISRSPPSACSSASSPDRRPLAVPSSAGRLPGSASWSRPSSPTCAPCPRWPGCPVLLLYLGVGEAPKIALIALGAAVPGVRRGGRRGRGRRLRLGRPCWRADPRAALAAIVGVPGDAAELLHATSGLGFLLIDSSSRRACRPADRRRRAHRRPRPDHRRADGAGSSAGCASRPPAGLITLSRIDIL